MKVCLVTQEYPPETNWGGIATYHYELAKGLQKIGHEVVIVSRSLTGKSYHTIGEGISIYRIKPFLNWENYPFMWRFNKIWDGYQISVLLKLRQLVKLNQIDIIESPSLHGEVAIFQFFYPKFPLVIRFHSSTSKEIQYGEVKTNIRLKISSLFEKGAIRMAKTISSVSKYTLLDNIGFIPKSRRQMIEIIGNPIDLDNIKSKVIFNNYSLPSHFYLLYVGRLQVLKGVNYFASALSRIFEKFPKIDIIFIGKDSKGPDNYQSMRRYILDSVPPAYSTQLHFIGQKSRDEVFYFMDNAQCIVFPSLSESFGYIVLEAMAVGTPIIATRSGGPQEIIEDRIDGVLIPVKDPKSIASAVLEILQNPKLVEKLVLAGKEKVRNYDNTIIAKQSVDLYEKAINSLS